MARSPLAMPRGQRFSAPGASMRARTVALLVVTGLGFGIGSAWSVLGVNPPIGAVQLGPWVTWPRLGSSEVDPYTRAVLARAPHLPVAAGEGLSLLAFTDSAGAALSGRCRYRIAGRMLPSRGWSLGVTETSGRALALQSGEGPAPLAAVPYVTDADTVSGEDGVVVIAVSRAVSAGVWLALPSTSAFGLALRFYDTPLSASTEFLDGNALPVIERGTCDA